MSDAPHTLVALLRHRAASQPDRLAQRFLVSGDHDGATDEQSHAELDAHSRRIGATLQAKGGAGERTLLLFPPGLDYVRAFFGSLYGGAVAVPAYPPDPSPARLKRTLPRLQAIVADSGARFVLTTKAIASMAKMLFAVAPELADLEWIATDALEEGVEGSWVDPGATPESLAFLQYTSGSTGSPRGVMLSHGNLMANLASIQEQFELTTDDHGIIWLPPYHDMGLIGGILEPLYVGFPSTLLSPIAFLRRPMRWMKAISHFGGTVSGGPNFAFALCIRKAKPADLEGLDLSSWTLAFTGAEPIRASTLDAFADKYAAHGFELANLYPCYGLAEATLIATGGVKAADPIVTTVEAAALEQRRAVPTTAAGEATRTIVGCGTAASGHDVQIVEPDSLEVLGEGAVGEIWLRGPSVAHGYWGHEDKTAETFQGRTAAGDGPYLRTGDLGFVHGGEVYVCGRMKDLIIVRGANHYPQDIEETAEAGHAQVKKGCLAAFAFDQGGEEKLGLVTEVLLGPDEELDADGIFAGIRKAVASEHQIEVTGIVLIAAKSIPKTSSGKIQRYAARVGFLEGGLDELGRSVLGG